MSPSERLEELYLEYAAERDAAHTHEDVIRAIHNNYIKTYQEFIENTLRTI